MKQLPIEAILDKMTTAEKANLCDGEGSWHTHGVERLGIPGAMMTDGPHGLRKRIQVNGEWTTVHSTCLPTASALAASWNREVAALAANTIAKEAVAESVSVVLGPGVNMKRSPLCGRNFEYFSEDPYFAGDFAAAYINAMQGNGVGSCIKHFAVNNQETRRFTVSANVAARPLHEIYLRAFEIAIERAKPEAIMESYNRINGKHAAESRWLLDDLLRKKWGFEGVVMSDWDAVNDRVASLEAGLDLEMPTSHGSGRDYILSALASGRIDEVLLDRSARSVLALAVKERPAPVPVDRAAQHAAALACARECMVLLKNEKDVLPLAEGARIAVIGDAEHMRYQGSGSSKVVVESAVTDALAEMRKYTDAITHVPFTDGIDAAVEAAKACGKVVLFLGLPESAEYEGADRKTLALPKEQLELADAVLAAAAQSVVVLTCGAPVELPFIDRTDAVLLTYLCGEATAEAAAEILFGRTNPSGKIAETFPVRLEDTPSYLNFPGTFDNCDYTEGIYIGYRYYEKKKIPVLFPFGHGLSYTAFAYSDLSGDEDAVTLTVKNTGTRAGSEVVQVYMHDNAPSVSRPVKELCGYAKVALAPGEEKRVTIPVERRVYGFYDETCGDFYTRSGEYTLSVGASSADIRAELVVRVHGDAPKAVRVHRNTYFRDVILDERYAPARDIFAAAMLPNAARTPENEKFGITKDNPAVRRRMHYVLRQAVYNNPDCSEALIEETIAACNAALENKAHK